MPLNLQPIKERLEKATPGPWYNTRGHVSTKEGTTANYPPNPESVCETNDGEYIKNPNSLNDAEFIAHAIQDVRALVAEVEELRGLAKEVAGDVAENTSQIIRKVREGTE